MRTGSFGNQCEPTSTRSVSRPSSSTSLAPQAKNGRCCLRALETSAAEELTGWSARELAGTTKGSQPGAVLTALPERGVTFGGGGCPDLRDNRSRRVY